MDPLTLMLGGTVLSSGIGALSSLFGSHEQGRAISNASGQIADATNRSTAALRQMFGTGLDAITGTMGRVGDVIGGARDDVAGAADKALGVQQPFVDFGAGMLPQLRSLLVGGGDMNAVLEGLPGFKFMQTQGQKAITNQATSRGLSGNALREGADFATGLAKSNWSDLVGQIFKGVGVGTGAANQQSSTLSALMAALGGLGGTEASTLGTLGLGIGNLAGATGRGIADTTSTLGRAGADLTAQGGQVAAAGLTGAAGQFQGGISNATNMYALDALTGGRLFGGAGGAWTPADRTTDLSEYAR